MHGSIMNKHCFTIFLISLKCQNGSDVYKNGIFLLLAIPAAGKAVTFSRNMKIATFHRQRSTPPLRRDSRLSIAAYFFFSEVKIQVVRPLMIFFFQITIII